MKGQKAYANREKQFDRPESQEIYQGYKKGCACAYRQRAFRADQN